MERDYESKKGGGFMAWITPKTDWSKTDRFNIEDYNRIKNNLAHLHERAQELYLSFPIQDMGEDVLSYEAYRHADAFNLFEENLEAINQNMFTQDYGASMVFFDNGPFIPPQELNRIEGATLAMMDVLDRQSAGLRKIPFTLGAYREPRI